jgi:LysM repeat protein
LVVKSGKENSDLITSADLRRQIQTDVTGKNNIKAGIAYLYTRAIKDKVDTREVIENAAVQEYKIVKGDTTDAVAKKLGTTRDNIMRNSGLNSISIGNLLPGQTIKFQKARIERYITGWNDWSNTVKAYNGGGDANYMEKVERAFQIITSRTSN